MWKQELLTQSIGQIKPKAFIEVVGLISTFSDNDMDHRVTAHSGEVLHRFSGTRAQQFFSGCKVLFDRESKPT